MTGKADAVRAVSQQFKDRTNAVMEGVMAHLRDDNAKEILGPGLSPLIGRGSLKSIVTFALYADVLRMVRDMVMADGEISDEEVQESLGLLSVLAAGFAKVRSKEYASFTQLTPDTARQFLSQYESDKGLFGHANEVTKWAGVELCRNISLGCNDNLPIAAFRDALIAWAEAIAESDEMADSEVSVLEVFKRVLSLTKEAFPQPIQSESTLANEEVEYLKWKLADRGSAEWLEPRANRFDEWLSKARSNDARAQMFAALCYDLGVGIEQDKEEAVRWYRAAADQGYGPAMFNLGLSYKSGEGVEQDDEEAVRWWRAAADKGYEPAMVNLGSSYKTGAGVEQDEAEAVRWYRVAAEHGNAVAMGILGICYSSGEGVEQDDEEAVRWWRAAADKGNARAMFTLGLSYKSGKGVEQDDEEAVRWWRAAADKGNARAMFNLGLSYKSGEGVEQDDEEAVRWWQAAADEGHEEAGERLASTASGGSGSPWSRLICELACPPGDEKNEPSRLPISLEALTTLLDRFEEEQEKREEGDEDDDDEDDDDEDDDDEDDDDEDDDEEDEYEDDDEEDDEESAADWRRVPCRVEDENEEEEEDDNEAPPSPSIAFPDPPGTIANSIGMKLVPIPAGEFMMGSPEDCPFGDPAEEFQHRVRITKPFMLGMHQVTQAQYQEVTGENPSLFEGTDLPVEHLTWKQAKRFCEMLSARPAEAQAERRYRLPTEAEWEYACRAGTTTPFNTGDELDPHQARFASTSRGSPKQTAPVGTYPPNAWGLFDMHGNVWEWTSDWFSADYFHESPVDDPQGPATGTHHTLRGGSASMQSHECRTAFRGEAAAVDGPETDSGMRIAFYGDLGIRVVCVVSST